MFKNSSVCVCVCVIDECMKCNILYLTSCDRLSESGEGNEGGGYETLPSGPSDENHRETLESKKEKVR